MIMELPVSNTTYSVTGEDIVTEFMSGGNLLTMLKDGIVPISVNNMISMAKQTASGMLYLSKERIVHRDLALRSITFEG